MGGIIVNQRKAGAILSYISLIVTAVASFIYVPVLLGFLTVSEYGVYELIGSLIAYLSVMDLGLSTTLNRFYVKSVVTEKQDKVENLLAVSGVIYLLIAALAVVAGLIIKSQLNTFLGASFTEPELELAHQMMVLVIINSAIVLPSNWFLAVISANERFIFARSMSILKHVLQVVIVIIVLRWHANALYVLIIQVAVNFLAVCSYVIYYFKFLSSIRPRLHTWDWKLVGSLFSFSFFILLNMIFDQVFWKTGQIVLGVFVGSSAVAIYGIATRIVTMGYMQASTGITSVFLPKLTAISARTEDMEEINNLFNRIGRIQAILVWGIFGGFFVLGKDFINLWAGVEFLEAYYAVLILMAGLSLELIQNLGFSILQAKNRMTFRSISYSVLAIIDIIISIPAAYYFGLLGVATTTAVLLFIGTLPMMYLYYQNCIGLNMQKFYRQVLPLCAPVLTTALFVYGMRASFGLDQSWLDLSIMIIVFIITYITILWIMSLNSYEKSLIRSLIAKIPLMSRKS